MPGARLGEETASFAGASAKVGENLSELESSDTKNAPMARTMRTEIGLMLVAVFTFSFGDALGKFMVATYPVGELLLLRACAALLVLLPLLWRQRAAFTQLERPWLQLLRAVLSTAEVTAFFWATVYLPLADVITYYLACPIFVTALSAIVLRERVGWRRWSAILVGFCGVLIALHPSPQTVSWPALIALGGSTSFAVLMLITRSLRATPDVVLASTQFAGTFVFGALLSPIGWITPDVASLGLFAAAGCISVAALFCVNRSLKLAPAGRARRRSQGRGRGRGRVRLTGHPAGGTGAGRRPGPHPGDGRPLGSHSPDTDRIRRWKPSHQASLLEETGLSQTSRKGCVYSPRMSGNNPHAR